MNLVDLDNLTPATIAALRAAVLGPNAEIDDVGNLSVAGSLSTDTDTRGGKSLVLTPVAVADLTTTGGIHLVHDALNPELGNPVVGGGSSACLVWHDAGAYRVFAAY